jgi:hypothetical protein
MRKQTTLSWQSAGKARGSHGPDIGAPRCKRCGSATEMAQYLPQRIGSPAFNIFRCMACGFLDWVAVDTRANPA